MQTVPQSVCSGAETLQVLQRAGLEPEEVGGEGHVTGSMAASPHPGFYVICERLSDTPELAPKRVPPSYTFRSAGSHCRDLWPHMGSVKPGSTWILLTGEARPHTC